MKKNDSINILFLFLCVLMLGFVYVNSQMMDSFQSEDNTESYKNDTLIPDNEGTDLEDLRD